MYQACAALWHTLSDAEKQRWQSDASRQHMTGFALWQSSCLRPNPGIYLPLAGGDMQGAIDMKDYHIHGLPLPVHVQDVWRRQDFQDFCLPFHTIEGARVYHSLAQSIPHNTVTTLSFNSQRWDNDNIHDIIINNDRLICKTPGIYIIVAQINFSFSNVGRRQISIRDNSGTYISLTEWDTNQNSDTSIQSVTIYSMALNDWIHCRAFQDSGGPLNITSTAKRTPEFMMQRISP